MTATPHHPDSAVIRAALPRHPPTLAQALRGGRANNLDLIRLAAALCVAISHAWPLSIGEGALQPLEARTGLPLGGWAVLAFFALSGILIQQSASTRPARAFWQARARRLLPALALALLVTLALAVTCGAEVHATAFVAYLLRGVTLVSIDHALMGAWPDNPIPFIANGPIWSLFHEVLAYALCFAAARLRLLHRPFGPVALGLSALGLWGAAAIFALPARIETFAPLWMCFVCGMLAWRFAFRIPLRGDLAFALAGAVILFAPPLPLAVPALGYGLLWLGFRAPPFALPADLSYGLYLYAWPVAQSVTAALGPPPPSALAILTLCASLPFAALSWWLVERPAATRLSRALG